MNQLQSSESLYFSEDELVQDYLKNMDLFPNIADLLKVEEDEDGTNGGGLLWSTDNSSDNLLLANNTRNSSNLDEILNPQESTTSESDEDHSSVDLPSKREKIASVSPTKVYAIQLQTVKPYRVIEDQKVNGQKIIQLTTIPVKKPSSHIDMSKSEVLDRAASDISGGLSRNAIAARENRMKKKKYVQNLEDSVQELTNENEGLRERLNSLESSVENLETEVQYLRNVLANVDEVSALVKTVRSSHFNCSSSDSVGRSVNGKRKAAVLPNGKVKVVKQNVASSVGGICLHVNNGQMSLEFCPKCSVNAVETWNQSS